jgi:hypothetical protein
MRKLCSIDARLIACAVFFLLSLTLISAASAQTAVDGAIGGTVLDNSGAVVSGAQVQVKNTGTNAQQAAVTDSAGYFRVLHLQPGSYDVSITAPGFASYRATQVTVQVGVLTDVQARLDVGASAQTVEVSGESPLVNTTSPDFAGVVDQVQMTSLPQNNYRWSSFALMTPGVVNDSNGFGLLSFRGQSTLLNNVTIDGTDDNQAYFSEERGRTRAGYSTIKASVQEFQVNTSNYSVEYGRSAGGIVNSVTKSGTNKFHGQGYYYDRDSAWAAQNAYVTHPVEVAPNTFASESFKPTDLRRQYGLAIGGPILRDRLHDHRRERKRQLWQGCRFDSARGQYVRSDVGCCSTQLPGCQRLPDFDGDGAELRECLWRLHGRHLGADIGAGHGAPRRRPDDLLPEDRLAGEPEEPCIGGSEPHALDFACGHSDGSRRRLWRVELRQRLCARQLDRRQARQLSDEQREQRSALYVWPRLRI